MAVIILAKKIVKGAVDLQTFSIRATWYPGQAGMEEAEREATRVITRNLPSSLKELILARDLSRYNTVSHSIGLVLNCFFRSGLRNLEHHQLAPEDVVGNGAGGVTASVPKIPGGQKTSLVLSCAARP